MSNRIQLILDITKYVPESLYALIKTALDCRDSISELFFRQPEQNKIIFYFPFIRSPKRILRLAL